MFKYDVLSVNVALIADEAENETIVFDTPLAAYRHLVVIKSTVGSILENFDIDKYVSICVVMEESGVINSGSVEPLDYKEEIVTFEELKEFLDY